MIIENPDALRDWLTSCLEPLCDADPEALAKYVMALIKKDKPEKDIKTICLDQLEVFLQRDTITFVDKLFETIANKNYLQGQPPASASSAPTPTPQPSISKTVTLEPIPSTSTSVDTTQNSVKTLEVVNISANNVKSSEQHNTTTSQPNKSDSTHESSRDRLRDNKRNNRSRSRSPLRRRTEFDSRRLGPVPNRNNGNTYFNDERRNRRGVPNRRAGNQRFGGYRNERDYRRPRDLKRGRSRSRSRSYSTGSSRSRSPRSRSRERSWSRERADRDSPSNKKSRPTSRPNSRSPSPAKTVPKDGEKSKKCRDYEEKGFCLKGHLCPYDHGNDPVVLDSNVSAALGFTNNGGAANAGLMPIPNSGIAPNAPNSNWAEPYNPEAPGMDPQQRPHPPPQGPPPMGPRMPPPYWGPMPIRGPMPPGPPLPPHQFMPPPGRPRELIGVPTIDNNHRQNHSNRTVIEPSIPMGHRGGMRGGHIKHMGRGGYRNVRRINNESADKTCLEVRKIPSNMNTISHLNQHFSKFGTIVNLQVCHEGDPEAALVQYSSHSEALSAIRSTEAVLNNRFIKVFWHSKELQQKHEQTFGPKTEPNDDSEASVGSKLSIKDRLGPKVTENESKESVVTAVNSSGTISRTVFDPSKLKKNNKINNQKDISNTDAIDSQSTDKNSSEGKTKSPMTDKTNKRDICSQQYKILAELLGQQKVLTTKFEKSTTDSERKGIKEMIEMIGNKIAYIRDSIFKNLSPKKTSKKPQTKEELMAEILNTDLDLFVKYQNKEITYPELMSRMAKLKKKERTCLSTRGRGGKTFMRRGRGLSRRGSFYGRGSNPLLKVDRRTRKLLIPDINEDDITDLLEHLAQFSDVEVIEPSSNGAVVTFKTRVDAEKAIQNIGQIKFKENCQLSYSWFDDNIAKSADKKSLNKSISIEAKPHNEGNDREQQIETLGEEELLDYEEDDTEDESEARNWKA